MKASGMGEKRRTALSPRAGLRKITRWLGLAAAVLVPAGALAQAPVKIPAPKLPASPAASAPKDSKAGTDAPKAATTPARTGARPTIKLPTKKGAEAPAQPAVPGGAAAQPGKQAVRWTAATPDQMVDLAFTRVKQGGDDALSALVVAASLDERAAYGKVQAGLRGILRSASPVADDARMLLLELLPEPVGATWPGAGKVSYDAAPDANGLVKAFAILGPFQDTGAGITRREGPEAPGQSFSDMQARYAWGVYDVAWRRVLPASATARGVPLDLYIHPRSESCTYLASKVTIPAGPAKGVRPILVHVAAAGAVRLIWDGVDVGVSEDVHPRLVLDRMAARIEAPPGDHLVAVKVCSGAVADEGRVRVRFTDEQRKPLVVATSSDLRGLQVSSAAPEAPAKGPLKAGERAGAKAAITRVQTSLEKGLDIGPQPTAEQALRAGVLRTLGGAEDARSPRAPGLLDRVARTPGISPDVLAMAGWISPFGSNRSGWLNLAQDRGNAERDPATAAFAQRRLAASNLNSHLVDWALSTLREEPLRSANDPEAKLIRALAKKHLGAAGLARSALEDLLAIADSQRARTPTSVWAEIANSAMTQPVVALRAARRLAEVRPEARDASYVRGFRAVDGASLEVAAAQSLMHQTSADNLLQIGRELYEAGRYAWAREAFYLATEVAPNRSVAFQWLAVARRAADALEKKPAAPGGGQQSQEATSDLARARDLDPSDPFVKAELGFRTGAGASVTAGRTKLRDEQYLPTPAVFLERARRTPVKKGEVFDRQLHWVRVVTYHPDKRVSQLMHYAREIVIEPRTESERYERQIPIEGDDTELVLARVHKKDGTVVMPEEQSSGGRSPSIRWPELKTGDVVEVAVRSWTAGPVGRRGDAPYYFIDYVGSTDTHPILYNEVVVDSPASSPLAIDVLNGKPERFTTETIEGRTIRRYAWDNPPSVPDEPLAPTLSESLPVVVGSTFGSWHEFREWYRSAVAGFTAPDDQVRHLAAELTKNAKTHEEKLKAIFDFVADDIRYVNYVSGEWWLPNRPQELLARRQGDCDDKALLLITLLKSIGIEATEVLIQTRYTGSPSLLRSEKAAIPVFDHGIAYLPGKNGAPGMWLDATSPQSRLGPLPSMDARTLALFVDEGQAKIIETPASSPADHGIDAEWTIKLSPSGAGDLVAKERHTGDAAFELRSNLAEADSRAQWVEQYASSWFPTIQVKSQVNFQSDLPRGAAMLGYEARSEGFARREGGELAVPISEDTTITSQLAPLVKRTLPVVLPPSIAPGHQARSITIVAPPGFTFADLPPGGEEQGGEFGVARLEFKRGAAPNTVLVNRSVVFDMSTIPVDKYASWRGWLQRVDGLMHRMVRLVPTGAAAKLSAEPLAAKPAGPAAAGKVTPVAAPKGSAGQAGKPSGAPSPRR